jgi:hypothetical protein
MNRTTGAVSVALVVMVAASGCIGSTQSSSAPFCRSLGRAGSPPVLLMAQSVPTASLVPCVTLVPAGWTLGSFNARNGAADFRMSSDIAGSRAVDVQLVRACDITGATKVPSDEPGTSRWERIQSVRSGYRGVRYYTFDGGCVRYVFRLSGPTRAAPVNDVSLAVAFVSRDQLRREVKDSSDGQLHLDPR